MRAVLAILWVLGSLWWLSEDQLLRDGDEEGHVGAAELMRLHLDGGNLRAFAWDTWRGDLGEYPPFYPALVGAWWWLGGSGLPGATPIRAVNLLGLMLAAWATAQLAGRLQQDLEDRSNARLPAETVASLTAFAVVLTLPLANGLARHFMPEGLLVGWVALSVWLAARAADRGDNASVFALGAALGVGMLIKQTFLPLAALPVVVAGMGLRSRWLGVLLLAASIAGPWYWAHLGDQTRYISSSVQAGPQASRRQAPRPADGQQTVSRRPADVQQTLATVVGWPADVVFLEKYLLDTIFSSTNATSAGHSSTIANVCWTSAGRLLDICWPGGWACLFQASGEANGDGYQAFACCVVLWTAAGSDVTLSTFRHKNLQYRALRQ